MKKTRERCMQTLNLLFAALTICEDKAQKTSTLLRALYTRACVFMFGFIGERSTN